MRFKKQVAGNCVNRGGFKSESEKEKEVNDKKVITATYEDV